MHWFLFFFTAADLEAECARASPAVIPNASLKNTVEEWLCQVKEKSVRFCFGIFWLVMLGSAGDETGEE